MKHLTPLLICFLFANSASIAQDEAKTGEAVASTASVLDRFVGNWNTKSQPASDSEIAPAPYRGTMDARMLGKHWLIGEYDADMGGVKFDAMQRLRYDAKQKIYVGTWVDSFFDYEWPLKGKLEGERLTINSEGPDPSKPGATSKFRDIYEFKTADLILTTSEMQSADGKWETFMTGEFRRTNSSSNTTKAAATQTKVMPFLMFIGKAEKAMKFYVSLFPDAKILSMEKYAANDTGEEGTVKLAKFEVAGQRVMCIDSPDVHKFTFTPSFSFFVECDSRKQIDDLFSKLSADGKIMMPLNNYGFSERFGWTSDRFGVSWQLNLAK